MTEPRAYTKKEMRAMFIAHLTHTAKYWATVDLSRPEFQKGIQEQGEALYRLEGFLFSVLVALDGGAGLPGFDLIPSPHPTDEQYHKDNGQNWWPAGVVINNCQLHDIFSTGRDPEDSEE